MADCGRAVGTLLVSVILANCSTMGWGQQPKTLTAASSAIAHLTFPEEGQQLTSLSSDGTLRTWDVSLLKIITTDHHVYGHVASSDVLSPDGKLLLVSEPERLRVIDVEKKLPIQSISCETEHSVALSQSKKLIAACGKDGRVRLWDVAMGELIWELPELEYDGRHVAIAPGDAVIATVESVGRVKLWEINSRKEMEDVSSSLLDLDGSVRVCFSPDNTRLAASGAFLSVFDLRTRTSKSLDGVLIDTMCFSPDGSLLAGGASDGEVCVWDMTTGEQLAEFPGQQKGQRIESLAFSAKAEFLAAGDCLGMIRIWEFAKYREHFRQQLLESKFHKLDVDGSRSLSRNEWMNSYETGVAWADTDLDEQISLDEYLQWQQVKPTFNQMDLRPVSLSFAWPDGLRLQVTRTYKRQDHVIGQTTECSDVCRFLLVGEKAEEGYRITSQEFEAVRPEPRPESKDPLVQLDYEVRRIEQRWPSLTISDPSAPPSVVGLAQFVVRADEQIGKIPGASDDHVFQRLSQSMLGEQSWRKRLLEDWDYMVRSWNGMREPVGISDLRRVVSESPTSGKIMSSTRFLIERQIAPNHIRLVVRSEPDPLAARAMLLPLWNASPAAARLRPSELEWEFNTLYITDCDPATLIPQRYVKTRTWQIGGRDSDGKSKRIGRTECWTYQFSQIHSTP